MRASARPSSPSTTSTSAAQLFPEYAAIYNNRGNLLLALGYPEEAIKDFNRAIVLAPGYAAALGNRAGAYAKVGAQRSGDPRLHDRHPPDAAGGRAARRARARALAAGARTPPSATSRARSPPIRASPPPIAAAPRPSSTSAAMPDAIEDLSRAIAFDANNAELYLLRGQRLSRVRQRRRRDEGLHAGDRRSTRARRAASRRAASPTASRKTYEEAFADLNRAIELDPRSALAFAYRAVIYKLSGQTDVGVKDAETAEKLDPDGAEVLWAKGEIEEAQGRTEQAIADYKKAVALQPRLKLAADGLQRLAADYGQRRGPRDCRAPASTSWRVVSAARATMPSATSIRRLRIPLEMAGEGQPRAARVGGQAGALKGIADLALHRRRGARSHGARGDRAVAILDLEANNRSSPSSRTARARRSPTWTWQDDRVVVASVDGATDEFMLRAARPRDGIRAATRAPMAARWIAVGAARFIGPGRPAPRRRSKPKTIFQLLFN